MNKRKKNITINPTRKIKEQSDTRGSSKIAADLSSKEEI